MRVGCKHLEYAALYILYANLRVSFRVEVIYQLLANNESADFVQEDKMVCGRRHKVFVTQPLFPSVTKRCRHGRELLVNSSSMNVPKAMWP